MGLAAIVIGPMAQRGWVLLLDWVTGPRAGYGERVVAGDSLPAGPVFFGFAAALQWVFGAAVGWLLPWTCLVLAGVGAARLVGRSLAAQLTAATAYLWNPFVHERLYSGQLAVLLGYAVLPYVAHAAATSLTRRSRGGLACGLAWACAGAASLHFLVLGAVVVIAFWIAHAVTSRRLAIGWLLSTTTVAASITAVWLLPIIGDAPQAGDARTIQAFATRPDPVLGLAGGVAAQRGFWRPSPGEPSSTNGWWWSATVGALGGAALVGLAVRGRREGHAVVLAVAIFAGVGWLLGQGGDGLVGPLFRTLADVPGFRIMREAGKFIALVSMAWAIGLGSFAETLFSRTPFAPTAVSRSRRSGSCTRLPVMAFGFAALPVLLSPGLASGVGGRLAAVRYPSEWTALRAAVDSRPGGRVVVLPWLAYFDPGFTNHRVVKHPARAFFGRRAEVSDDADVAGLAPSTRSVSIAAALTASDGRALAVLGIGWVIGPDTPRPAAVRGAGFQIVFRRGGLALYQNTAFQA